MGGPPSSERHLAELIAQKQRLQQLESEYALKIQKLKEAQALRNKVPSELPPRASAPLDPPGQNLPPSSPFPVPQPSLHDLTQDKLTLDSEDVPEAEDLESEPAAATGSRRRSLRQSSCSFTKPNLEQLSSTPVKDAGAGKSAKAPPSSEAPAEMFAGLDLDSLKLRFQQQPRLGELLQAELQVLGGTADDPPPAQVSETGRCSASINANQLTNLLCRRSPWSWTRTDGLGAPS